ncbi:MAG TPA: amino acid dehydrogenase [Anaerolineae bacterium]|nr:amino acid dehydrogenase [Anaerolineae bacterium]
MTNFFRERIKESINNSNLQTALDNNTERRLNGRAVAFESIPDWRERRQRAHKIRADVIDNLDEYLNQFIKQNEANDVIIHRAKDSKEAIQIVLNIVGGSHDSPRLIAKSKSMVTEEIELNHALEKENIKVVETDLGEYIVQLRKERPSHIITPAAHLKKEQVAQLFHEKLNIEYTEDIPTLTATARKILREVFLTADVGISGVNFGVAETGNICVVSNEGNARMVATIPPIHIALMGMERLVPTLDDLSLFISLLARSATGQKISVYTQLLQKPLPNQTRHIIILDNGRSRLRNSPLKESLYCIRCGACLNACPVFRELSGHAYIGKDKTIAPYPGPIGSVISPGLMGENFVHLAQASSLCGACKDACPVDIDLPKMLTRVRAGKVNSEQSAVISEGAGLSKLTKLFLQIYTRLSTRPKLFAFSQTFASLITFLLSPFSQWIHLPALTGWGYSKDFPRFASQSFRSQWKHVTLSAGRVGRSPYRDQTKGLIQNQKDSSVETASLSQNDINLAEQFTKELIAVSGNVYPTKNVQQEIIEFIKSKNIDKVFLERNTLDESLLKKENIDFTYESDPQIRLGVTNALVGLADTGSVLEADEALHPSLLPEIHIAILKSKEIVQSLPDAIHLVKDKNAAVFITGPSRTADIEMTLTIGVHGPKELHVFVDVSNSG